MTAAVFLDRDGVIIENRDAYVRQWADVAIFSEAIRALVAISASAYKIVLVTNQSAVGRGLISRLQADRINRRLADVIRAAGGRLDGVYMCPHAPAEGCACRKPEPGLIREAAQELNLDLASSILIGDAVTDLLAGSAAGVGRMALVLTGRGRDQASLLGQHDLGAVPIFPDLEAALSHFGLIK